MGAPPGNAGAATIPQSNPGNAKQATELIAIAQKAMSEALPKIPLNSKSHSKAMKIAIDLDKLKGEIGEEVQANVQQLMQLMQSMKNEHQMKALGAVAPQPNQPPAMTPPPAPAAPPPGM